MWRQVYPELPDDLAKITTSVWDYEGYGQVGVMRNSFLAPPVLWFQLEKVSAAMLKQASQLLTDLQLQLHADLVLAEAKLDEKKSQRFLTFLGFDEGPEHQGSKLFTRRV